MSPANAHLEARQLSVRFGDAVILREMSFAVARGELVALIGPNGAGKTTALRAAAGLIPYDGTVRLGGADLAAIGPRERARRLAYLPQGHVVHWPMTVFDVVALGRLPHRASIARLDDRDAAAIAAAIAAAELEPFRARRIDTLSEGEKARVMIARALSQRAPLLIADEPTAALDPYHQLHIMELLRAEADRGAAVIAVLHDLALAAQFAARLIMLSGGLVVADGPPEAVLAPERLEAVYHIRRHEGGTHPAGFGPRWTRMT